jgi:hypothetical protein
VININNNNNNNNNSETAVSLEELDLKHLMMAILGQNM